MQRRDALSSSALWGCRGMIGVTWCSVSGFGVAIVSAYNYIVPRISGTLPGTWVSRQDTEPCKFLQFWKRGSVFPGGGASPCRVGQLEQARGWGPGACSGFGVSWIGQALQTTLLLKVVAASAPRCSASAPVHAHGKSPLSRPAAISQYAEICQGASKFIESRPDDQRGGVREFLGMRWAGDPLLEKVIRSSSACPAEK